MIRCANCNREPGVLHTSGGSFCCGPCMHEFQGWPDCSTSGPGHEKYPLCPLHQEVVK